MTGWDRERSLQLTYMKGGWGVEKKPGQFDGSQFCDWFSHFGSLVFSLELKPRPPSKRKKRCGVKGRLGTEPRNTP